MWFPSRILLRLAQVGRPARTNGQGPGSLGNESFRLDSRENVKRESTDLLPIEDDIIDSHVSLLATAGAAAAAAEQLPYRIRTTNCQG
jgi:hypothetical protein